MDLKQLKTKRTHIRRLFTKSCNDFEILIQDENTTKSQLIITYKGIEDKAERLFHIDSEVSDTLFKQDDLSEIELDEAIEVEVDSCEAYREKWFYIELNINEVDKSNLNNSTQYNDTTKNLRLPKLELKCFDGNLRNWIGFWSQFKKIHEDTNVQPEDKFQYLIQATVPKSAARDLVESYPPSADNYYKAIEVLKARFARDELLIEVYVRDLINLVLERSNKGKTVSLCNLYDKLITQLHALESLGVTSEKYAAMLYPLVESALPEDSLLAWERHRTSSRLHAPQKGNDETTKPNYLTLLLDFLKGEVESEERLMLARSGFAGESVSKTCQPKKSKYSTAKDQGDKPGQPTAAAILVSDKKKQDNLCGFCGKASHRSADCANIVNCSLDEKKEKLKKSGSCFTCLKQGHSSIKCKGFVKCLLCKGRHHTIMCSSIKCLDETSKTNQKADEDQSNGSNESDSKTNNVLLSQWSGQTYLQTLVIKVVNPSNQKTQI